MPASVYKLVFHDADLQKFAPSKLEIGTYTSNTVKLLGSCAFNLVHPDIKCLQEVTFYVASNTGRVLLSCARFDYLTPTASLITSSADHPKKTKSQVDVHVSEKESTLSTVSNQQGIVPKLIKSKEQILQAYPDVFGGTGCFPWTSIPSTCRSKCYSQAKSLLTNTCTTKRAV